MLVFGVGSTGAASDLSGATELAVKMVRDWGLSPRLGPIGYGPEEDATVGTYEMQQTRPYAEATQRIIDQEVSRMLVEAEGRARQLLVDNRKALDAVAALLVERETISGAELIEAVRSSGIRSERHPVLTGS